MGRGGRLLPARDVRLCSFTQATGFESYHSCWQISILPVRACWFSFPLLPVASRFSVLMKRRFGKGTGSSPMGMSCWFVEKSVQPAASLALRVWGRLSLSFSHILAWQLRKSSTSSIRIFLIFTISQTNPTIKEEIKVTGKIFVQRIHFIIATPFWMYSEKHAYNIQSTWVTCMKNVIWNFRLWNPWTYMSIYKAHMNIYRAILHVSWFEIKILVQRGTNLWGDIHGTNDILCLHWRPIKGINRIWWV